MFVTILASRKGGVGKTTLARHLAVEAERRGQGPVAIVDTDPQGGLAKWWNRRESQTPAFIETSLADLAHNVAKLRAAGYRQVFIDTPPAIGDTIRAVVDLADLVIIPCRPSPDDLDAIGATVDLVEKAGKPLIFVVNGATRRARLTGQAAVVLSQHGIVALSPIHHSVAFPSSAIRGEAVGEVDPSSVPAREITELWDYVGARQTLLGSKPASRQAGNDAGHTTPDRASKKEKSS